MGKAGWTGEGEENRSGRPRVGLDEQQTRQRRCRGLYGGFLEFRGVADPGAADPERAEGHTIPAPGSRPGGGGPGGPLAAAPTPEAPQGRPPGAPTYWGRTPPRR